ncbi:ABC transporter permease [Sinomonas albida]|uniref:ABC transporter permease n=1 Tax=Sinomonas albida TaxID=369942 RepID=UPI0010A88F26|nr:ABC transporter permease [Sinomonas albida]
MSRMIRVLVGLFVVMPIAGTALAATSVDFSQGPWGRGVTLDWLGYAWAPLAPAVARSLGVATLVVGINLLLGGVIAWRIARSRSLVSRAVGYLVNVPLAVPGIALSVALVGTFPALRPSGLLLVMAHVVLTLPFTLAALVPVLADESLRAAEEVAASLGAGSALVIRTITVPACGLAIAQSAAMVFALSFGEFNISFFVNPPATPTVPFALFDAYSTGRLELASAQTVIFIAFIVPVLLAIVSIQRRTRRTDP